MNYRYVLLAWLLTFSMWWSYCVTAAESLKVGFASRNITPDLKTEGPVWLAGYVYGRQATSVHDPLYARAVVLSDGKRKLALVSVDLVGMQLPAVRTIRGKLSDFKHVTVSSTHNHEGPDVIGIWGETPFKRGVHEGYLRRVQTLIVEAVREAAARMTPSVAHYGTSTDDTLLYDGRKPIVKDGVLRAIRFSAAQNGSENKTTGLIVQWNCHPEALGPKNTAVTADFPAYVIKKLGEEYGCPVVYFTGAVGGLMAPPRDRIRDSEGKMLGEGDFAYAEHYGYAVADLAKQAIERAEVTKLTPITVSRQVAMIPVENPLYRLARAFRVVRRTGRVWTGDWRQVGPLIDKTNVDQPTAIETEVSYVRMGNVDVVGIPGELYPELVYGNVQKPVDPNADFTDAKPERCVTDILPSKKWLLIGLANDEVGYIIPRCQWDQKPPFAYGRYTSQYGEINSCSSHVAPIVMQALAECVVGQRTRVAAQK